MGLAASQARLLTITARKADCEFQSMALSHQKLALSRDMENISTHYQNALNTTKLVFDYYGTGDSDMALTYGLLMSPSIYNDYYPKLITDAKDRVVLNSAYAAVARSAGIPAEGLSGTPSSDVRNKFVEALANEGIISPVQASTIQGTTYANTIGLGTTVSSTLGTTEITYNELLELLRYNTVSTADVGIPLGATSYVFNNAVVLGDERFGTVTADGNYSEVVLGVNQKLTIDMLLSDTNYMISALSRKGDELPVWETYVMQQKVAGEGGILCWIRDQFAAVLGGTPANDTALQYAFNSVYDLVVPSNALSYQLDGLRHGGNVDSGKSKREEVYQPENSDLLNAMKEIGKYQSTKGKRSFDSNYAKKSNDYLGFVFTGDKNQNFLHKDRNDKSQVSINLNNLVDAFLTSYVSYMKGLDNTNYQYQKGDTGACTFYDPTKDDFKFTILSEAEDTDDDTVLYANFYDSMFNMICLKGWTENDQIDDEKYMSEMLKNGMVFISSISDDGFYYQGNYSTNRNILEVPDQEAISKAEAQYNALKARIENKEQTIDLKMKNLDTEISSLTTEYDTTKQVITKAIEKSFKRYDA